jgi:hypothetical protein
MSGNTIPFACTSCKSISKLPIDSVKDKVGKQRICLVCGVCGRVNEPQKIENSKEKGHVNEPYLVCLPFTGPEKDVPLGPITVAGRTLWTDSNGKNLTTEEFITKHGLHPGIFWRNKIIEEQAVQQAFLVGHPAVSTRK